MVKDGLLVKKMPKIQRGKCPFPPPDGMIGGLGNGKGEITGKAMERSGINNSQGKETVVTWNRYAKPLLHRIGCKHQPQPDTAEVSAVAVTLMSDQRGHRDR